MKTRDSAYSLFNLTLSTTASELLDLSSPAEINRLLMVIDVNISKYYDSYTIKK